MRRIQFLLSMSLVLTPVGAQGEAAQPEVLPRPTQDEEAPDLVFVPRVLNQVCPIMGKPVSTRLFTDTKYGRLYLCCRPCAEEIMLDVDLAYRSSFAEDVDVGNTRCPITGEPIEEEDPRVSLQGLSIRLCSVKCIAPARELAQVVIVKVLNPEFVHVDNRTCPVTGKPAGRNTILVVKQHIVHVEDVKVLDAVKQDPDRYLAKAKEIAAREARERAAAEAAQREAEAAKSGADEKEPRRGSGEDEERRR